MRTLVDLRKTLEDHAAAAPDSGDMAREARSRGLRLRRRRRLLGGTGAALAVLAAVAVTVPLRARSQPPEVVATTPPVLRTASQFTVDLAEGSSFVVTDRESFRGEQSLRVRNKLDVSSARPGVDWRNEGVDVKVHDPGTFQPGALLAGEKITFEGRPAWWLAAKGKLGFEDPAGTWVVLGFIRTKERALEVAADLRLGGPPVEARAPFRLGWVPEGLPVTRATVSDIPGSPGYATFGFGDGPDVDSLPLSISARPLTNPDWETTSGEVGAPEMVGGHRVWYLPGLNLYFRSLETNGLMLVETDSCMFSLKAADRTAITEADLRRTVENATFGDCMSTSAWRPPAA